jgi:hypothetical protein
MWMMQLQYTLQRRWGKGGGAVSPFRQGVIGPPLREYLEFLESLKCLTVRPPRSR